MPSSATNFQRVTTQELVNIILRRKGALMLSWTSNTIVAMKASNPFGVIRKQSNVNGSINSDYGKAVNRQRGREDKEQDFEVMPPKWGQAIQGTPFFKHRKAGADHESLYLRVHVNRSNEKPVYRADGSVINVDLLQPHMRSKGASRQGTDKEIVPRTYKLESITSITLGKVRYEIDHVGHVEVNGVEVNMNPPSQVAINE